MAKIITDRQARNIKPGIEPASTGITGLTLRPGSSAGHGKWVLRYTSPATGKRREMGFGTYPEVSVARALKLAHEAREAVAAGIDPINKRRAVQAVPTFEEAARERWAQVVPSFRNAKHRKDWIISLEQHAFPRIGAVRVDKLQPDDFARMLRPIWLEIPETARRVKQRCHNVMAACWAKKLITSNPVEVAALLLSAQPEVERHQPAMLWQAVPAFVEAQLSREPLLGVRAALLWTILTCARSGEVRGATWAEIDLQARLWTVPASRMKAYKPHRVPLSDAAIKLLQSQPRTSELVFPSVRGKQLSDMALSSLLRTTHTVSDTPGCTATAHGFRSSFRNWAADHGYDTALAERALAHTVANKVQAAYERTDRLAARVAMMDAWAAHVMGGEHANVTAIYQETRHGA